MPTLEQEMFSVCKKKSMNAKVYKIDNCTGLKLLKINGEVDLKLFTTFIIHGRIKDKSSPTYSIKYVVELQLFLKIYTRMRYNSTEKSIIYRDH